MKIITMITMIMKMMVQVQAWQEEMQRWRPTVGQALPLPRFVIMTIVVIIISSADRPSFGHNQLTVVIRDLVLIISVILTRTEMKKNYIVPLLRQLSLSSEPEILS